MRDNDYYLWGHMKTLVYESKVDSSTELRDRIFAAAEHVRNHPDNIASAIQTLLKRAENCLSTVKQQWIVKLPPHPTQVK